MHEMTHLKRVCALFLLVPALALLGGCEKDEGPTSPDLDEGLAAGLNYLGYADAEAHNPTCIRCHSEETLNWRQTGHARALHGLYTSDHANASCLPCHTTGWDGNEQIYGADEAWEEASADTMLYADVQCETCHGPASQHNSIDPDATDVLVPADQELWVAETCGVCHEGAHHPYLSEWAQSAHAEADVSGADYGLSVATDEECAECHVAQSFAEWVKSGDPGHVVGDPVAITCQACHDSHSRENPGQLRLPLGEDVLCGKCHNTEGAMPGSTVHHATWEVYFGELGFEYPGETYTNSAHTTALGDEACITCHVVREAFNPATGASTGHTFAPKVRACAGCHVGAVDFDLYGVQTQTQDLIDQLQAEIDASGPTDETTEAYERAQYVLEVAESEGSLGVHNTDYIQKLLQDAIDDYTPTGS
ncbi:MAG: cytochrome c3 family protein [bacterium]